MQFDESKEGKEGYEDVRNEPSDMLLSAPVVDFENEHWEQDAEELLQVLS